MAEVENETQARQGSKGKPVLYVLVVAIVLAAVAGVGLLTWQGEKSPDNNAGGKAQETVPGAANPATGERPAQPK